VVVVDDIHWADPALLDLIEYLHAVARRAALLLLVTARPQFLDRPTCWMVGAADTTMVLEPLSAVDAAELAARLRGPGGLDAATRERIVARAEGNPLVIEELLRFLTDGDGRGSVGGVRSITRQLLELPFPSAIDALVGAELDRLPPEERVVLELASVVGRIFNWTSVAALASAQLRPRVGAILLALARRKLIRVAERELDEDTFAFRHGILHEATYRAVPKRKRAILHARAAEMLAEATGGGASEDEMVGHHLGQAYRYLAQLAGDELPPPTLLVQPVDRPPAGAIP
jgi:predicted ATPase